MGVSGIQDLVLSSGTTYLISQNIYSHTQQHLDFRKTFLPNPYSVSLKGKANSLKAYDNITADMKKVC